MPTDALSDRPQRIIADLLVSEWDPTNVDGYDPSATSGDAYLPLGTGADFDDVGAPYPSVVVTPSNQTSGGETSYDFTTGAGGPGQVRRGSVLATIRAQDERDYRNGVAAETLAHDLRQEVERICRANATGGTTEFTFIGSQPAADAPDDRTDEPPVRLSQAEIRFGWLRA
jgi:hypothetical protein